MMKTHHTRVTTAVLLGAFLAGGCATTPVVPTQSTERISGVTKLVLAPPMVEYIDANTGNHLPQDERTDPEVRSVLVTGFRSELAKKQVAMTEVSEILDVNVTLTEDLGLIYRTIKQHSAPLETAQQEHLSWLAAKTGSSHLMFCRCRLHIGPGGFWDPFTGAIASNSSRVVLECHLYDLQNKRVVWTSAAQVRASPSKGRTRIATMVPLVLETLEFK